LLPNCCSASAACWGGIDPAEARGINMDPSRLDEILARLHAAERELAAELDSLMAEKRAQFRYTIERGRVSFERGMRELQRRQRTGLWRYLREAPPRHILTAPVIYAMIVPIALLDLGITVYQHICFRAYRIPRVRRADHLVIDRQYLAHLNAIEKLNCVYCGYANGTIAYAREIIARTEQFWCPIKHARRTLDEHGHYGRFFDYGDAQAYQQGLEALRKDWERDAQ